MTQASRHIASALILTVGLSAMMITAQDVSFEASAPAVVKTGDQFGLSYTLNANPSSFQGPDLGDFNLLSGPSRSSSTSIQIINGRRTQSITNTYTYLLQATGEGKFTIPPATAEVGRKQYSSNPVTIEVTGGSIPQAQQQPAEDIFVRVLTSGNKVYQGQHVVATLKLYTRLTISGLGKNEVPDFAGFWTQDINIPDQISLQRENVNGVIYNTGVLRKVLLFPQRTGNIEIEPFKLEVLVRQRVSGGGGGIWDDFFSSYRDVSRMLSSRPVAIEVMPLPGGKPDSFKGAVGDLDMTSSIDNTQVMTNDAITLKLTINGNGNIRLLEAPVINFPPDFESYDPRVSTSINNTETGQSGSKTFEYLIIPRHAGIFRIPPVFFSYFDLSDNRYRTVSSPEFTINVAKSDEDEQISIVQGLTREEYQRLNTDILFIKTGDFALFSRGNYLLDSTWFWLLYAGLPAVFLMVVALRRAKIRRMQNTDLVKNRRASKIAREKLKLARSCLRNQQQEEFYDSVLKALLGYVSDKLNIPVAGLNRERTAESLSKYNAGEDLIQRYLHLVNTCEMARYAPRAENAEMNRIYSDAAGILSELEKNLKK